MNAMRYEAPGSIDEVVALLAAADGDGRILAGGTDLLVQMQSGFVKPGLIVDVKKIAEATTITAEDGGFRIGAAVCGAELGEHAELGPQRHSEGHRQFSGRNDRDIENRTQGIET